MILVSACLLGVNCKYNGGNNKTIKVDELLKDEILIPVCPEQLGGMETPRNPSEIILIDGKKHVVDKKGNDVTFQFVKGGEETLKIAKLFNIETAILKSNSPSCGCGSIYDGTFTGKIVEGNGITAAILKSNNIKIYNEISYFEKLK
ncbi:MAG: DUF523 domain-containing protein [Bacillota bacterium]|nr:DUF523 domain-containing protein [Bacillota bacterium]